MIQSMTGYARGERRGAEGTLVIELRSINHRYLETYFRLPELLRGQEAEMREQIGARLRRGKVDCALRLELAPHGAAELALDQELVGALAAAAESVAARSGARAAINPFDLLRWPGVVREREIDTDRLGADIKSLLGEALEQLVASRRDEGARIATLLRDRARAIAALVADVRERLPAVRAQIQAKLLGRLAELNLAVDDDRLQQELVFTAQRLDVAEEMDRLDSHIRELEAALKRDEPVGRRLDFLMQEFNREANTLGSKSQDAETTHAAVEIKVLIEQMREQVQNVE